MKDIQQAIARIMYSITQEEKANNFIDMMTDLLKEGKYTTARRHLHLYKEINQEELTLDLQVKLGNITAEVQTQYYEHIG